MREIMNVILFSKPVLEGTPKFKLDCNLIDVPNIGGLIMRIMQVNTLRHNHPLR